MKPNKHESSLITSSSDQSIDARYELFDLMNSYPATIEEKERSLSLFMRGSAMARLFAIRELYEQIVNKPGIIIDLGTWRGQTAVACENLRAIFEPLHFNRRIICLDTFEGYVGFSDKDKPTEHYKDGTYDVGSDYAGLLERLLVLHEKNNAMGHINGKHRVIKGDCRITLPQYFEENSNEVVSLAFFDVNAYDPTLKSFEIIYDRMVKGGIIAFWQLTKKVIHAEGAVYAENILNKYKHDIRISKFYPSLSYIVKE